MKMDSIGFLIFDSKTGLICAPTFSESAMPAPADQKSVKNKVQAAASVAAKVQKFIEKDEKPESKDKVGADGVKASKAVFPFFKSAPANIIPIPTKSAVIKVYESKFEFSVFSQWPERRSQLEDAPEIMMLLKKPNSFGLGKDSFLLKCLSCFGTICKNRVHALYGLGNFKPLLARTNHTIEYVDRLVRSFSSNPPSPRTSLIATTHPRSQKDSDPKKDTASVSKSLQIKLGIKQKLLKEFYESAYHTLHFLRNGITLYKQTILSMSFTRYAEENLKPSEIKLTSGKSIIGSCMWVITYALQQLQEDPDVEQLTPVPKNKVNPLLFDLAAEILAVITLSFHTWAELVTAITVLERIHRKTEQLFHKQTTYFHSVAPPDSEDAIYASVHLKKYRRLDSDSNQLRRFDTHSGAPMSWSKRFALPRLLYQADYAKPGVICWRGFDPLGVKDKVTYLKDLLNFVKLILKSVKDSAGRIVIELQGQPGHRKENTSKTNLQADKGKPHLSPHHVQQSPLTEITCYEDGLDVMDALLSKKLSHVDWTQKEMREFFEMDKVFLDDMDCITLGAGITRAILHDARHTMHICYETSRLINLNEFLSLPDYLKVYKKLKEDAASQSPNLQLPSSGSNKKLGGGNGKTLDKNSANSNPYDIEELKLELKNVATLFRCSPYLEIVKTLPIYCSQVGITLQEAELVFTPSSEKLLSKGAPPAVEED